MRIEIVDVKTENKGKYRQATVTYKTSFKGEEKVDAKKIASFANKEVFKTLSEAKQGDIFNVKSEKNEKGYWDWTAIDSDGKNTEAAVKSPVASAQTTRSNFETTEERAKRQVYIVRQSSVSSAIALLEAAKDKEISVSKVIATAKELEKYVFGIEPLEVEVE